MTVPAAIVSSFEAISASKPELAEDISQVVQVAAKEVKPEACVRTVLLADAVGRVQVIMLATCLLDLDALNRGLERDLRALPGADVDDLKQSIKWEEVPVLPDLTKSQVVADETLQDMTEVFIPSDQAGKYLRMSRALLEAMLGQFSYRNISIALSGIDINRTETENDVPQIYQALHSFTKFRICKRLEDTLELPPLPESTQRIIRLRIDPDAGVPDLADLVESDPSLAAQVVSWASSSFYAAPGKVRSVHDAISRVLGFDLVMNLAMGLALGRTLEIPDDNPGSCHSYWDQAVWMAALCGNLCTRIPKEQRPEFGLVYLSGLLHNFGYLVLAHVFPPHFLLINRYTEANQHCEVELCEQHLLGITREQIGSQLMYTWNMPEEVVVALRQQKNPDFEDQYSAYSLLIFVATQFLRKHKIVQGPAQAIAPSVWSRLHLTPEDAAEVAEDLRGMSDELEMLAGNLDPS